MDWTTIALGLVFAIANPWAVAELMRTASARKERRKHAREELADFIEVTVVRDRQLGRNVVYEMANALAQKREVSVEDVYRPLMTLHEVLARLRTNPALAPSTRVECENCISALMAEFKSTEGLEFLNHFEATLIAAERVSSRSGAKELLKQLIEQWGTHDDRAMIARLKKPADNMSSATNRAAALDAVKQLREKWAKPAATRPGQPTATG